MYNYRGWYFPNFEKHFQSAVGDYPTTVYQQTALDTALKYVKNFNVAIDIGANVGLHSIRLASTFKKVYSFEPSKINFECLQENLKKYNNIEMFNLGLGDRISNEILSWPKDSDACGSFSIIDFKEGNGINSEEINCVPLDSFDMQPDFIKIDTQGFESYILEGSLQTLKNKPVLLVESETEQRYIDIEKILKPLGYKDVATIRKKDHVWIYQK
jgi:FkbM family methyltransferase